jgi:hypothetical protein
MAIGRAAREPEKTGRAEDDRRGRNSDPMNQEDEAYLGDG